MSGAYVGLKRLLAWSSMTHALMVRNTLTPYCVVADSLLSAAELVAPAEREVASTGLKHGQKR